MLRAVLAVALAAAIVAVAVPAVEDARVDHADASLRDDLRRLRRTAVALAASSDPVPVGARGARATVTLRLPGQGWHAPRVAYVAVGGVPPPVGGPSAGGPSRPGVTDPAGGDVFVWRVAGGPRHVLRVPVDVRTVADGGPAADPEALVLRDPGRRRLALRLVRVHGRPVVVVRRGFIGDGGTTPGRDRRLHIARRGRVRVRH